MKPNILVYVTDAPYEADLWVYETSYYSAKGTNCGLWCFIDTETDADFKVGFVSKSMAQITIYYVYSRAEAGWKKDEKRSLLD